MNWMFGDNINTDLITPGRYNITTDAKKLAEIAFIEYRPEFRKKVKKGDFIIAGENFGCGSSRETAAIALKYAGVKAILAKSFARIFYRNCLNIGMLLIEVDTSKIDEKDDLNLYIERKVLIPPLMLRLYHEGGIIPYLQKNGLKSLKNIITFQ